MLTGKIFLIPPLAKWSQKYEKLTTVALASTFPPMCVCVAVLLVFSLEFSKSGVDVHAVKHSGILNFLSALGNEGGHALLCFIVLSLLTMIAEVVSKISTVHVEKDWITRIAAGHQRDDPNFLSVLNGRMRVIDLSCAVVFPMTFSSVMAVAPAGSEVLYGCAFIFLFNILTIWPIWIMWRAVYFAFEDDLESPEPEFCLARCESDDPNSAPSLPSSPSSHRQIGFQDYVRSQIFPASLSYCLLHFTVLTDHNALLTAWLFDKNISAFSLAVARGMAAAAGIAGTIFWPYLRKTLGLDMSSLVSLTLFLVCIGIAACGVFHTHKHAVGNYGGYIVLAGIIVSRPFLWVFDLANSQLFQERVETSRRRIALAAYQTSTHQSLELIFTFLCSLFVRTTHDFLPMSAVSFGSILLSLVIFCLFHKWQHIPSRSQSEQTEFLASDTSYQRLPASAQEVSRRS